MVEICTTGTTNITAMILVLVFLTLFGYGYNWWIAKQEEKKHDRGYTAILVIGGCLVTLIGGSLIAGVLMGVWFTACFAASGLPMTFGSMQRNARARVAEEQQTAEYAKELLNNAKAGGDLGLCDQPGNYKRDQF